MAEVTVKALTVSGANLTILITAGTAKKTITNMTADLIKNTTILTSSENTVADNGVNIDGIAENRVIIFQDLFVFAKFVPLGNFAAAREYLVIDAFVVKKNIQKVLKSKIH